MRHLSPGPARSVVARVALLSAVAVLAVVLFVSAGVAAKQADAGGGGTPQRGFESPRLARLARELGGGSDDSGKPADDGKPHGDALAAFFQEVDGHAPLVEPSPGNDYQRLVTFLWKGSAQTRRVGPLGTKPSFDASENEFKRFLATNLWFKTERLPADSRFGYAIAENDGPFKPDPLNPRVFAGRSVVELPDAPQEPWLVRKPDVPPGSVTRRTVHRDLMKEDRPLAVYLPAGYRAEEAGSCSVLVVFDGESFGSRAESAIPTPTILDNLCAQKTVAPTIALLLDSQSTRDRDLVCSEVFADFVARELLPWCRREYHAGQDPARVTVAGSSYGGLCAAYVAFRHSAEVGNVLSMSGSFSYFPGWTDHKAENTDETGWLTRRFANGPKLPVQFYLAAGRLESNLLMENRHLRDVLEANGYTVNYTEYSGGHDYLGWRGAFVNGLVSLASRHEDRR